MVVVGIGKKESEKFLQYFKGELIQIPDYWMCTLRKRGVKDESFWLKKLENQSCN